MFKPSTIAVMVSAFCLVAASAAMAQQVKRTELKRADISGTNMEVITAIVEAAPGVTIPRHFHYGEETFYVLQGATLETRDGKRQSLKTGFAGVNAREVPHAGFKVVGKTSLRLLTNHIVDKGKPLSVSVDQ